MSDKFTAIEYSICEDCLTYLAHGWLPESEESPDHIRADHILAGIKRETEGGGHFVLGVAPTEDDPEGNGYEEFSHADCELCSSGLAGSRYGATLLVPIKEQP